MPTLGHAVVGIAAARLHARERPRLRAALVLTALATFPDLDLLSGCLGLGPQSAWAHRGALHSLLFALVAAMVGLWFLDLRHGIPRAFGVAFAAAASHGLLDAMTRGGDGVMLLWPFSRSRFASPWPLLPHSPLGEWLFTPEAIRLALREALVFAPLLVYAFWPSRLQRPRSAERAPP
jgi:inner membrane protein